MKFEITKNGTGIIRINKDTYLSFGSNDNIKMVLIRYNNGHNIESKFFPISMLKLPRMTTKSIGLKNIKIIRDLVRDKLVDGVLPLKAVSLIGESINKKSDSQ